MKKQISIKSLQANIKDLKAKLKSKDAEIEALSKHNSDLFEQCKETAKERDMHHMEAHRYKTDAIDWGNKARELANELATIKSKWFYKIFLR